MAFQTKKQNFHKILLLVFGIAFGLVALVLAYQSVKTSSDIRSRAAQTNQIYKQWEFNGSDKGHADTEGWNAVSPYTGSVKGGIFVLSSGLKASTLPAFRNTSVGATLPQGLKSISLSMAVGPVKFPTPTTITCPKPPVCTKPLMPLIAGDSRGGGCPVYRCVDRPGIPESGGFGTTDDIVPVKGVSDETDDATYRRSVSSREACPEDARMCPDGSSVGRSGSQCTFMPCPGKGQRKFVAHLYYKLTNSDKFERPIQFSGLADGSFQTFTVNLPNANKISIDRIRVVLTSGVKTGETVAVDWIRILGPVVKPTPADSCQGLRNGSSCKFTTCLVNECPPGKTCPANPRTCTIQQGTCQNNRCIPGTSPMPTSKPTATSTPGSGCYYTQVQCFKAPCDPILVCPTSSPTPYFRPAQ